jgi:hypothetical protein
MPNHNWKTAESRLEIKNLEQLSQALTDLKNYPFLASRIQIVEVEENDVENDGADEPDIAQTAEDDSESINAKRNTEQAESFCSGVTSIVNSIAQNGSLMSFKWAVNYYKAPLPSRPQQFWNALSTTSSTLKQLHIGFYTHEIHNLRKAAINPFLVPFERLESLNLQLDGGHGEDARDFDAMLGKLSILRSLTLSLPSCDLENCRIKGLTYDWTFPLLEHLSLSAYVNDDSGLPQFLSRHPSIQSLDYDLDSDKPITDPFARLSNLLALNVKPQYQNKDRLGVIPSLKQLRINSSFHDMEPVFSLATPTTLRCLDIQTSYWSEEGVRNLIKDVLPKLTELAEFGVEFQSENLSWYEDGKRFTQEPLGLELLV